MEYTNSALIKYTQLSPNHSGERTKPIDRITIHCIVGQATMKSLCDLFSKPSRKASSNYGVCTDGICLIVEEKNRSWCTSSAANDQRAITIETASDTTHPYAVRDDVYKNLLELVYDICKRNGKDTLLWFGDKEKTLNYQPKQNEMVLTVHRWFANKSCPGEYLYNLHGEIARITTERLQKKECTNMCKYWDGTKCTKEEIKEDTTIDVGDTVQIIGDTYYSGQKIPSWVKAKQWIVYSAPKGSNRIVINASTDGKNQIMSPVHIKDLKLIKNK